MSFKLWRGCYSFGEVVQLYDVVERLKARKASEYTEILVGACAAQMDQC